LKEKPPSTPLYLVLQKNDLWLPFDKVHATQLSSLFIMDSPWFPWSATQLLFSFFHFQVLKIIKAPQGKKIKPQNPEGKNPKPQPKNQNDFLIT